MHKSLFYLLTQIIKVNFDVLNFKSYSIDLFISIFDKNRINISGVKMICIVVLGIPRSGTSAIAGVLHYLGVFMGEQLGQADEWNPKGSYEDLEFVRLHRDILKVQPGQLYYGLPHLANSLPPEYLTLIERRKTNKIWGLKCSYLTHLFWHFRRAVGEPVKVIATRRNFFHSCESLAARKGFSEEESCKRLGRYLKNRDMALTEVTKENLLWVDAQDIWEKPCEVVRQVSDFVGLPVTQEAIDFLDSSLKRF